MDLKAHDKQHHAVVASIVAQPGPSFSAGPRRAHASECVKSLREENFDENEAVLAAATREAVADAATLTPEMAAAARAGEEAYCAADRDRTQQEQKLNLRSRAAEDQKARDEVERARARYLAEEEEAARARRIADDDTIRARRRDEEEGARRRIVEEAARAAEASRRLAAEVIAVEESVRTKHAVLQEEARVRRIAEEAEASARCRAAEEEVRDRRIAEMAATERHRAAIIADEERRMATLKLRREEHAAQDRQQPPEMQTEEAEEELEEAHRTGVLTNNALATHLWPRPRLRSIPISSPHGPQLVSNFVPAPAWYTRCSQLVPS